MKDVEGSLISDGLILSTREMKEKMRKGCAVQCSAGSR